MSEPKVSKETLDYYDVLGVSKTATDEEIKKAYKKEALRWHPDRNLDNVKEATEKFKLIAEAHRVLTDPEKRKIYHEKGAEGLKDPRNNVPLPRGPDIIHEVPITLEEFYCGCTKEIKYDRLVICEGCKGSGAKADAKPQTCRECNGQGIKQAQIQLAPGFIVTQTVPCDRCSGSGKGFSTADNCRTCWGERRIKKPTVLLCTVLPGANVGTRTIFPEQSHEVLTPDGRKAETGNLLAVLAEVPHATFTRKGINLFYNVKIDLKEALCGSSIVIKHLDGHDLTFHARGVIKPEMTKILRHEGMPSLDQQDSGDLHVKYTVNFPDVITDEQRSVLSNIL